MLYSVWRSLALFARSVPALGQLGSGSNIPVSSPDLGYRLGSIEAKIEGQGKALDELSLITTVFGVVGLPLLTGLFIPQTLRRAKELEEAYRERKP